MNYLGAEPARYQLRTLNFSVNIKLTFGVSPFEGNVTNIRPKIHFPLVLLSVQKYPKPAGRMIPAGGLYDPFCDVKTMVHLILSL